MNSEYLSIGALCVLFKPMNLFNYCNIKKVIYNEYYTKLGTFKCHIRIKLIHMHLYNLQFHLDVKKFQ